MCLAVPAKIVEREAQSASAVADLHGNRVRVSTALLPEAQEGDWILVHAGFAIQKLDGDDVRETWAVLQDLSACERGSDRR